MENDNASRQAATFFMAASIGDRAQRTTGNATDVAVAPPNHTLCIAYL
jgi:hypothetical protein